MVEMTVGYCRISVVVCSGLFTGNSELHGGLCKARAMNSHCSVPGPGQALAPKDTYQRFVWIERSQYHLSTSVPRKAHPCHSLPSKGHNANTIWSSLCCCLCRERKSPPLQGTTSTPPSRSGNRMSPFSCCVPCQPSQPALSKGAQLFTHPGTGRKPGMISVEKPLAQRPIGAATQLSSRQQMAHLSPTPTSAGWLYLAVRKCVKLFGEAHH